MTNKVLLIADCNITDIQSLLKKYQLNLKITQDAMDIPGSYWGDSEAGLISNIVYVRSDTPIHSMLHETCHYICMDNGRRHQLHTNAEGDYDEENGVCYLQILLANDIPEMGKERMLQDMDSWGYTFRLGSAKKWFEEDAQDAKEWLQKYNVLNDQGNINYTLRK